MLKEIDVRDAFKRLGRNAREQDRKDRWKKKKQRERSQIEGFIGNSKESILVEKDKSETGVLTVTVLDDAKPISATQNIKSIITHKL